MNTPMPPSSTIPQTSTFMGLSDPPLSMAARERAIVPRLP